MIKVMFIAPYNGMANTVSKMDIPEQIELHIEIANLEESKTIAVNAEREGYDLIISRGGTATLIEEVVSIPVIHINITGYDMLRIFTMIKEIDSKVALVGFPNIVQDAETICSILDYNIKLLSVKSSNDVNDTIKILKEENYSMVIGDVVTIERAKEVGLQGLLLTSGKEGISDSFNECIKTYNMINKKFQELEFYKASFDSIPSAVLILNKEGAVKYRNRRAIDLGLKEPEDLMVGLTELAPEKKLEFYNEKINSYIKIQSFNPSNEGKLLGIIVETLEDHPNKRVFYKQNFGNKPLIVGKSEHANEIRRKIINHDSLKNIMFFWGEKGTGKRTTAEAIHFEKYKGNKSFFTIESKNLIGMSDAELITLFDHRTSGSVFISNAQELSFETIYTICSVVKKKDSTFFSFLKSSPYNLESLSDIYTFFEISNFHFLPLRERKEDINLLINSFLCDLNENYGSEVLGIREDALNIIESLPLENNIRELRTIIEELVSTVKGHYIEIKDFKNSSVLRKYSENIEDEITLKIGELDSIEKQIITHALTLENGNQSKAAKRLGISRSTLWRKLNS